MVACQLPKLERGRQSTGLCAFGLFLCGWSAPTGNLRAEIEALHNGADVGRKAVDVVVQIRRKLVGIVQQSVEAPIFRQSVEGELGQVVKRRSGDAGQLESEDIFRLARKRGVFFQHGGFDRARMQSKRRSTVNGRMTLRYSLRL